MKMLLLGVLIGYLLTVAANEIVEHRNLAWDISSPVCWVIVVVTFIPAVLVFMLRGVFHPVTLEGWKAWLKKASKVNIRHLFGNVFFCYDPNEEYWYHRAWLTRVKRGVK